MDEIPVLCEKCLGDNLNIKMTRETKGAQCKLCTRAFTVFLWDNSRSNKLFKTTICFTCARQRNCCQSCMLDLTYGVSLKLRDLAFKMAGIENDHLVEFSKNDVTKRYNAQLEDRKWQGGGGQQLLLEDNQESKLKKVDDILKQLAEAQNSIPKHYNSKQEKLSTRETTKEVNDTDISKLLKKLPLNGNLTIPKDESVSSFFIFGINDEIVNSMIQQYFQELLSRKIKFKAVILNHQSKCGYVHFDKKADAQEAANKIEKPRGFNAPGLMIVNNTPLRVTWGKVKSLGTNNHEQIKLGVIVRKQVKVLAEKDRKAKSLAAGATGEGNSLKSLSSDFEI